MFLGTKTGVREYDESTLLYALKAKPNEEFVVVDGPTIYKGTGSEIQSEIEKKKKVGRETAEQTPPVVPPLGSV